MDLERFKDWVYKEFRINLHAYKENQLHRRLLSLMSRVGAKSVDEYIDILKKIKNKDKSF
ncbi:chemotaxis protein CheR [Clostridium cochlearium]|nr:chemotaxis protein CheR [Clostridium cochlearium]